MVRGYSQVERGKPFFLDPKRRHATAPWKGERVALVAYTVNTLGKAPESELQALELLGFPLPGSTRLLLTQQQDARRVDAFDCFEEEPLKEAQECVERVVGGNLLRGGGWKEAQKVKAGTVKLEVSWNLKHQPVPQAALPEQALHTLKAPEQVEQPRRLCQVKACGLNHLSSGNCGSHFHQKRVKCAHAGRGTWLGTTCLSCVSPSLCTLPTSSCCLMAYKSP